MCRIAGIISKKRSPEQIKEQVKTMCWTLRHGGPDDQGIYLRNADGLVFGHRRLSIIDLSARGHQPMSDDGERAWITFNGEIYNYPELKRELLAAGAHFRSETDTEVILQAYLHWGIGSFSRLRGIFAFALFDSQKALTYLVRDSSGVKPLYYHAGDSELSFASEVSALKAAGIAREADPQWKIRFLAYGHIPEPYTTQKGVLSLGKGEFLCWDHRKERYRIHSYEVMEPQKIIEDPVDARDAVHLGLDQAVSRQLLSDAPIGVFLSGGIDSSIISLLADRHKEINLKTVSIYFDEKAYDERTYQNLILKEIEGEKFAHLVTRRDFDLWLPRIVRDMDMPTTDGINTWFISKFAHEDGLKAVLSGVGADELFGGYPSFKRIKYLRRMRRFPASGFAGARFFTSDRFKKISFLTYQHPAADYLMMRGHYIPADIAEILHADEYEVEKVLFDRSLPQIQHYTEEDAAWLELNLYMQNQLLRDADVMGMSHGLEVRVPFLDEDFKRTVSNISPELRFSDGQPKRLLIETFDDLLPRAIWDRAKMGFTFPLQQWMREHPDMNDESLYRGKRVREIVRNFRKNNMHWSKVFSLYQMRMYE